nr:hypothetical protein [Leifsonia sp. Leaf325]
MIELIHTALPSRFATVSDIIANTAGALVGAVFAGSLYLGRSVREVWIRRQQPREW